MGVLLLCARFGAPAWCLFAAALPAGCMPSMGSLVRARWALIYRGSPNLHTAYAFESVVDEIVFIIGPILSVGLCTAVFPEAGPPCAGLRDAYVSTAGNPTHFVDVTATIDAGIASLRDLVDALNDRVVVAAVGPTCARTLEELGAPAHVVPEQSKMGPLVLALAKHLSAPAPSA